MQIELLGRLTNNWHLAEPAVAPDMPQQLDSVHIWHHDILQGGLYRCLDSCGQIIHATYPGTDLNFLHLREVVR